jgi:CheY-like chemotaxis protein
MGSRVIPASFAIEMGENSAETGEDGLVKAGQNSEPSLDDSDVSGSVPSNVSRGSTMPEWGGVPELLDVKGRRRILIVDDELAIADTLQMIFHLQRYDARVAYTAERAAELMAKWQPELAIVDVILPEMNGIDLAIVIRANYPKCHVILFSGNTNTSTLLEEALRKGHNFEVLAKPVPPDLMLTRASELLGAPDDPAYD